MGIKDPSKMGEATLDFIINHPESIFFARESNVSNGADDVVAGEGGNEVREGDGGGEGSGIAGGTGIAEE